ncbi:MAG: hypothetical protein HC917_14920 [Richelia sp. SM2_1_7]|nr:hypothetical protein [Richelia sp. SM2_1_7]
MMNDNSNVESIEESDQRLLNNETNWNEESLAKLLGYNDNQTEASETETIIENEKADNIESNESNIKEKMIIK